MKTEFSILKIIMLCFIFIACNEDDDDKVSYSGSCDMAVIVSMIEFEAASQEEEVAINGMEIIDNCLEINFSASGCSGDDWEVKLIDSGSVMESFPQQRNLILSLNNPELCDAYITKTLSFDIAELQVEGNAVMLHFENTGESILYEY